VFAAQLESLNAIHVNLTFEMDKDKCLMSLAHFEVAQETPSPLVTGVLKEIKENC
jgi:hypothetical protein